MLNSKIFFLFFLISCATAEQKNSAVAVKPAAFNPEEFKIKCEKERIALACARYGYLTKDISYTKEACILGDENSCFNLREIENKAPSQNFSIINSNQSQIFGCYINHSIDTDSGEGVREDKKVDLNFVINTSGMISSLSVQGEKLSDKFKECVVNSFGSRKFIPAERDQSIRYSLVMPAVKRDKRLDKRPGGL